jgi:Terminase RNaseH-like domain
MSGSGLWPVEEDALVPSAVFDLKPPLASLVQLPTLHIGQARIRAAIEDRHARFVVVMCGRRWGKTTDGVEWVAQGALAGLPCAWMAPSYKLLGEAWREIVSILRPAAVQVSEQDHRILLKGGGSVECWTLDSPDPARGRKYGRIVLDEAGIVRNLLDIWNAAIRPTLVDLKGHARFYGTPKGRTHGFVQLFTKGETGEQGWASFRAPTRENQYIPASEIEAARADLPSAVFAQEFEGIPADDSANPFGQTAILACLGALSGLPVVVWGWDFARAQDWTVGVGLDEAGNVCRFERWQHTPWGETKRDVTRLTGKVVAIGDSTGIGDAIVEDLQRLGVPVEGYMFTPKSKQQLMERLAGAIQARELTFPDGVIRAELETFEYEYTAHGVRYEAPEGLHDDCVMALALALYGYDSYGFGLQYQRRRGIVAKPEPQEGISLGYDYLKHRPAERLTAEQEFAKMMGIGQAASPLAGRSNQRLPRR